MPNYKIGPLVHDDPRKLEKIKLKVSSEAKSKGKGHLKDPITEFEPTDDQLLFAEVIGASVLPSVKIVPTPPPRSQGTEGSCVSWAVGYVARSVEQYFATGASSYNDAVNVFSPEYLFNYCKSTDCTNGSALLANLDLMKNKGVCLWSQLPYTSGTCDVSTAAAHDTEAANYRITDYFIVSLLDRAAVKSTLVNNKVLYIGVSVDSAFYAAGSGFIWSADNSGTFMGQHAVVIVGYDDSKNAYKVQNSWGASWSSSGFLWIDYDFMETGIPASTVAIGINGVAGPVGELPTLPSANAGYDISIPSTSSATLDGTASYDPDGYIASYLWEQVSGPNTAVLTNPTAAVANASTLVGGTYVFKLTVTDNDGNTASDTVNVVVATVSTERFNLTVRKTTFKGVATHVLDWSITTQAVISTAQIQSGNSSTSFTTLYNIVPYSPAGSYSYKPGKGKKYYRLKVTKATGESVYTSSISL